MSKIEKLLSLLESINDNICMLYNKLDETNLKLDETNYKLDEIKGNGLYNSISDIYDKLDTIDTSITLK